MSDAERAHTRLDGHEALCSERWQRNNARLQVIEDLVRSLGARWLFIGGAIIMVLLSMNGWLITRLLNVTVFGP